MRAELTAAIDRGEEDTQILNDFVLKYGPVVLAAPTTTGFNRAAWLMPYLALLLGLAATVIVVRLWKSRPAAAPAVGVLPADPDALEALRRRVHEETEV
jgi:cytochrome c-type biogenesis protein CcmH/NrfF